MERGKEICPLFKGAAHLAVNKNLPLDGLRCDFYEADCCEGSTNPDDCPILENFDKYVSPDTRRLNIITLPAVPLHPYSRFIKKCEKAAGRRGLTIS